MPPPPPPHKPAPPSRPGHEPRRTNLESLFRLAKIVPPDSWTFRASGALKRSRPDDGDEDD